MRGSEAEHQGEDPLFDQRIAEAAEAARGQSDRMAAAMAGVSRHYLAPPPPLVQPRPDLGGYTHALQTGAELPLWQLTAVFYDVELIQPSDIHQEVAFSPASRFTPEQQVELIEQFRAFARTPTLDALDPFLHTLIGEHIKSGEIAEDRDPEGAAQKILLCCQNNIYQIATIFSQPDGLEEFAAVMHGAADGCVANMASQLNLLVHRVLLKDAPIEKQALYTALCERIIAPLTHEYDGDVLSGSPHHDPLKDHFIQHMTVSYTRVFQQLEQSLEPQHLRHMVDRLEREHPGVLEYLETHDFDQNARLLCADLVLRETVPTVAAHPALMLSQRRCQAIYDAVQRAQQPPEEQERGNVPQERSWVDRYPSQQARQQREAEEQAHWTQRG